MHWWVSSGPHTQEATVMCVCAARTIPRSSMQDGHACIRCGYIANAHFANLIIWFLIHLVSMQAEQKQMKLKILQKVLVSKALARVKQASSKHAQLMKDGLLKALSSSSQFVIQGKVVSLSA